MIAFDNAATTPGNGALARTVSFTTSGTDRFLVVTGIYIDNTFAPGVFPTLTYNGVSLSIFDSTLIVSATAELPFLVWYLINPTVGANNLVITPAVSHPVNAATSVFNIVSYTGVRQVSPFEQGTFSIATGASNTQTATATTILDNAWRLGHMVTYQVSDTFTAVTGTIRQQASASGSSISMAHIDDGPITPPGAGNTKTTTTGSDNWAAFGESIKPSTTVSTFIPQLIML